MFDADGFERLEPLFQSQGDVIVHASAMASAVGLETETGRGIGMVQAFDIHNKVNVAPAV